MRRLEHEEDEQFWEGWVEGTTLSWRKGRIGTSGNVGSRQFSWSHEAEGALQDWLDHLLAQGFVEVDGASRDAEEDDAEEDDAEEDDAEDEDAEEDDAEDEDAEEDDADESPRSSPAAPEPPPAPTLPARFSAATPAPADIAAARDALDALANARPRRSWKLRRLARDARRALARVGGIDPQKHSALDASFDAVVARVVGKRDRLPLQIALGLLYALDAAAFVRAVTRWSVTGIEGPMTTIAALKRTLDSVRDPELALQVGAVLTERRLPAEAWRRRFGRIRPFLEAALEERKTTLPQFLATIPTHGDPVLAARIQEAAR